MSNLSTSVSRNAEHIAEISSHIIEEINVIPEMVRSVDQKVDRLPNLLRELGSDTSNKKDTFENINTETIAQSYLDKVSFWGGCILYAAKLANATGKAFNFLELSKATNVDYKYCWGYFMACSSTGVIVFTEAKNITKYDKKLGDGIRDVLLKKVDYLDGNKKLDSNSEKSRRRIVEAIEKYFS